MRKSLQSFQTKALALLAACVLGLSATAVSARSWAPCTSICLWCKPSAECLVAKRPVLRKQPANTTDYLSALIQKYREFGATEAEVQEFLNQLEIQFKSVPPHSRLFDGWFISPAHAQTEVACVVPEPVVSKSICVAGVAVKAAGAAIAALRVVGPLARKAVAELSVVYNSTTRLDEWVWPARAQRTDVSIPNPPGDCKPDEYDRLSNEVNRTCHGPRYSCTSAQDATALNTNLSRAKECYRARHRINMTYFRGGNQGHITAENFAIDAVNDCIRYLRNLKR